MSINIHRNFWFVFRGHAMVRKRNFIRIFLDPENKNQEFCQNCQISYFYFGAFGSTTKEPYTIILCLSCVVGTRETSCCMYIFFTYIHNRNNATVTYFLKFISIFLKFIYSLLLINLNFMCFDTWATKTKLCVLS